MPKIRVTLFILSAVFALLAVPVFLQAQDDDKKDDKDKDKLPSIADKTEDLDKREGFFIFHVNEKKNTLMAEIPSNRLNSDFLISGSVAYGPLAGLQAGSTIWRFERQDKTLLVVRPNVFYTASGDLKEVIEYSYPDEVLTTVPIVAETGGNVLIDLKSLLVSQSRDLVGRMNNSRFTVLTKAKSFDTNSVVELQMRGARGGSGVYFNLGELPGPGYKPRPADMRVGYFVTAKKDFSADPRADTLFVRNINRWRLEKQDPSLSLSPPKEPIVIYIEDTVPVRYRRWVREGIEVWNEAFEEIGFVDAIEVRQQTSTNQFADYDPEDARYNFFRWITSERPFAIAPSRVDPRTGEVIDSDILFDDSMVRYFIDEFDLFINSVPTALDMSPRMRHWLARNPHEYPDWNNLSLNYSMEIEQNPALSHVTPEQLFAEDILRGVPTGDFCSIGDSLARELAFAHLGMEYAARIAQDADSDEDEGEDGGKIDLLAEWPDEFIGPLLREIVAHEFGHTLGLRHNFKASAWKTYEEISNATDPEEATVASVMDYNVITLRGDGTMPAVWVTPTIGPYDHWAIEYGYAVPGSSGYEKDEAQMLDSILEKVIQPELAYGTDEDTGSPDPLIRRWDMGSDSLTYFEERNKLANKILDELVENVLDENESYSKLRRAFGILFSDKARTALGAAAYLGGYDIARYNKGDGEELAPITVTSAEAQRRALNLMLNLLFREDSIEIDPEMMRYLTASRWYHQGSRDMNLPLTYPIQDTVLRYQELVMFEVLNPQRIQWIYDQEFFTDPKADLVTLPEVMQAMTNASWSEVLSGKRMAGKFTDRNPMIPSLRRNLQRAYLGELIEIATAGESSFYPTVARTLAFGELARLGDSVDRLVGDNGGGKFDAYTLSHLRESQSRIRNALDVKYTEGGSSSGGFPFILMFGQEPENANESIRDPLRRLPGTFY